MTIRKEILDELIRDYKNPEDLLGENGLLKQLTKALLERAMNAELTHELGFEKNDKAAVKENGNRRNGTSPKTVKSKHGKIELQVPRDRQLEFEPQIIRKHQRRFDGFDQTILSLYSRGLSTREIKAHLEEIYSVEVSPDLISSVTEAVIEEVREWQTRPLESVYPIVYLDALRVKIRYDGTVSNRCIYLALDSARAESADGGDDGGEFLFPVARRQVAAHRHGLRRLDGHRHSRGNGVGHFNKIDLTICHQRQIQRFFDSSNFIYMFD